MSCTDHRTWSRCVRQGSGVLAALLITVAVAGSAFAADVPASWLKAWPSTDFNRTSINLDEIQSGGPPKDGIPSIDNPVFVSVAEDAGLADDEPVIGLSIAGDARAYPLQILIWHEIANDVVGGVPVAVTYCPLCNAAIVFDRRVDGRTLSFGTTGKLRRSDLVMYDRETESWWQQFLGEAIVGKMTGQSLQTVPARLESFARFRARHPAGRVQVPNDRSLRPYGRNPYVGYDTAVQPFLFEGALPPEIPAMAYVVAVDGQAWLLDLVRRQQELRSGDLIISWTPGSRSALDTATIAEGRDVGNVVVQRETATGLIDVPYDLTFAFVFHAFRPDAPMHR
ncbi:DUF3179 domain-containing protein [Thalassobaculum sp.]|uniref:DUF3179 domain-containing protein n=1 Tax=Thalassobaculum sp. TaxID=2022740 RepID=UPI0032ED2007